MKGKLILILFLMLAGMSYGQETWKKEGIKVPPPVCYASPEVHKSFIGPPAAFFQGLKSGSLKPATIKVTYVGFSFEAQQAFQYAVDIWKNLIYSPVPIRVKATWQSLSKGVLGSCAPADFYHNFNSTQIWNCYYPIALVEKMLGQEMNTVNDYEIVGSFNKDFTNWYFGTDGKTPSNQYDFVSTVLHELAHGFGFSGYFYTSNGRGGYGSDGSPAVFDRNVKNKSGENLVNSTLFPNPSVMLYQNLTSQWLEFDNHQTVNSLPRLYAPSFWDGGSSIYHLDDSTYPTGDPNSLMTPYTGMGEAIHDPGPNTLSILYQIGWKSISIYHKPLKDIEFVTAPINFDAKIESDYDLDSTKLFLVYSINKFVQKDSVRLNATKIPATFNAQLIETKNGEIRYYFSATDVKNRRFVFPSSSPIRYLSFKIGVDKVAPVVTYEPIKYMLNTNLSAKINVVATDNIGVKSVTLEYFVNGGLVKSLVLKNDSNDLYSGNLVFPAASLKDGDVVSYRVVAVDSSSQNNTGRLPLSGYNTFKIEGFRNPVDRYVNNFSTQTADFISTDFSISTVTGFDGPAMNSPHPYPSPDTDNVNFNFISILKYPIILKTGGKMSFNEIVLVEPGDPGTKFGDANFWDYVIEEGSKDGGSTWKPLIDGYDSNAQNSWYNLFMSSMVGNNSTAVPTKDLFVKREIDLLANGNFKAGDTIQVRFRLFSDPYSHGWGWIISNLAIQEFGTGVNPILLSSGEVSYFPNPATDRLNLQIQAQKNIHKLLLKVYNSSGVMVYNQSFPVESTSFQTEIDVSNFVPGLYLFALEPENGQVVTRKILIQ